ncbi:MAG TPA: hypothetical protein ENI92_02765, partial [Bacteroidetes bacterium]|nr:hypothetical protein [Bacteroidota bacterium]
MPLKNGVTTLNARSRDPAATIRFTGACVLLLLCLAGGIAAQDHFSDSEVLFRDDELPLVQISLDPDSLAWLLAEENLENRRYLPASIHYLSSEIDTTVPNVGFRLRGNTSRYAQKKSFKVSFDAFDEDGRFHGLKTFNLNGEHNDPSIVRSKLCWDLFKRPAVPSSRAAHVKLYINGEYRGLYIHVEDYDKTFLDTRFGNKDGNFYKCLWPATLEYIDDDPDSYKFTVGGRRAYDLRTNRDEDDYTDLAHLIRVINLSSEAEFVDSLEACFDVWGFLKALAVEVLVGHWDNYWYNKNNYYLYHNTATGRFEYIPYDLDNTFGVWWSGIEPGCDWGVRNLYQWGNAHGESRPLVDRVLAVQQYRNLYTEFLLQLLSEAFNEDVLDGRLTELLALIEQAALTDPYRPLDYGWSQT